MLLYLHLIGVSTKHHNKPVQKCTLKIDTFLFKVPLNYSVLKMYTLKTHKCNIHGLNIKFLS